MKYSYTQTRKQIQKAIFTNPHPQNNTNRRKVSKLPQLQHLREMGVAQASSYTLTIRD